MSERLTREDAYRLGYKCIICVSGNNGAPNVDGREAKKLGHNEGVYGWNWNLYQIQPGVVLVNGYRNFPHGDNEGMTGFRESKILSNYSEFEHVETLGNHECLAVFDRSGEGFTFDISNGEFAIVG